MPETSLLQVEASAVHSKNRRARLRDFRRAAERLIGIPIPRYLRASQVLFIHIPKNAGFSISQAIYGRQVWHRTALFISEADPEFFSSRLSFAVVRNPWDRLVSAYEYCRGGGTVLARLEGGPPRAMLESFERFVLDYLLPHKNRLNGLDEVLREQNFFVNGRDGKCLVNHLGRYEDLAAVRAFLVQNQILKSPLAHLNATPGRESPDFKTYYVRAALVDAVAACYERDICQFGYQFE